MLPWCISIHTVYALIRYRVFKLIHDLVYELWFEVWLMNIKIMKKKKERGTLWYGYISMFFSVILTKEKAFVTSYLLPWHTWGRILSKVFEYKYFGISRIQNTNTYFMNVFEWKYKYIANVFEYFWLHFNQNGKYIKWRKCTIQNKKHLRSHQLFFVISNYNKHNILKLNQHMYIQICNIVLV